MIELKDICKSYKVADFEQTALDGVSLAFRESEFVAVLGPSGSGKTTLLNILGGLDHADSGDIVINGVSTQKYKDADWDTYRNHRIGFIFQSYNLIPHQSIRANVELALTLSGVSAEERKRRAIEALERVGLRDHVDKRPNQLSGGQMQRVAIARALINDPDIVLADEPTGALDTETGIQVIDLLSEISRDRLVIMVTHNPELANAYANRIVRLSDGRVTGDTNPLVVGAPGAVAFDAAVSGAEGDKASENQVQTDDVPAAYSAEQVQAELNRDAAKGSKKHSSMSFLTALSLSFNNLMTKKGRTFLTAFAGSIGIIGIAAILALSNGVNNYIQKTESEAMSSFPLTVSKSSFDLTKLFTLEGESFAAAQSESETGEGNIKQAKVLTDMFAEVKNNDLASFKEYLDNDNSPIHEYTSAIQCYYDTVPFIYSQDSDGKTHQLAPSEAGNMFMPAGANSSFSAGPSGAESFQQMIDEESLITDQMDVVAGRWPSEYDEAVLVLSEGGVISDYTLYSIGFYNPDLLAPMFRDMLEGKEVDIPETNKDFSYEDALGMTFKVVSPSATYKKNDQQGSWTDMSKDDEYIKTVIEDGVELKIVGVVQPKDDANMTLLREGVAYTGDLARYLSDQAAQSQVVKDQLADSDRDIFTGKTFDELKDEQGKAFNMDNIFSVDEDALNRAFGFDTSALDGLGSGMDPDGIDMGAMAGSIDPSGMKLDPSVVSSVFSNEAIAQMLAGAPKFSLDGSGITGGTGLSAEQQQAIEDANAKLSAGLFAYMLANVSDVSELTPAKMQELSTQYLQTAEAQAIVAELNGIIKAQTSTMIEQAMQNYITNQFTPYLSSALNTMMEQAAAALALQMAQAMTTQIAAMTDSIGSTMQSAISGELAGSMSDLSSALSNGFTFDANAFASAIKFNMTEEDLSSLVSGFMNSEDASYSKNLSKLGYIDEANPSSIAIFPKDFVAKDKVVECIDEYNAQMKDEGNDDRTIEYADIAGVLMKSVNSIVNMISAVLIAFVSISLVVSSIMIGIITYISVLERRKEIGILRAIGASKRNIANVFIAETVLEGLMAGVFAIAVVSLFALPVNALVQSVFNVERIVALPWGAALVLIGISVLLTFIAGLIPSTAASRRDPVEALRSE